MPKSRILLLSLICSPLLTAETPPCGRAIVTVSGAAVDDRFLPAPPAHVKASLLRALPVLGAKPTKEGDLVFEAKSDVDLFKSIITRNDQAGMKGIRAGMGAMGTFNIEMTPGTQNGVAGTRVHVEFHKNAMKGRIGSSNQAMPLLDETACLVGLLSPADPQQNPRGAQTGTSAPQESAVVLPQGTPVTLLLRDFLYSKDIKNRANEPIVFEVAEDVNVRGVTAIRKGALGTGKFLDAKAARGYRRNANLVFVIEKVTAVDGQSIAVSGATEKSSGAPQRGIATMSPAFGWLDKGVETVIRAGTGYDTATTAEHTIQVGR
jgi:hypothetical protein